MMVRSLILIMVPVLLLQLILMIVALVDLIRREAERVNGPKWLWALIVILVNFIGPILYFIIGRKE